MRGPVVPFIGPRPPRWARWALLAQLVGFVAFAVPYVLAGAPGALGLAAWLVAMGAQRYAMNAAAARAVRRATALQPERTPVPSRT